MEKKMLVPESAGARYTNAGKVRATGDKGHRMPSSEHRVFLSLGQRGAMEEGLAQERHDLICIFPYCSGRG